MTPLLVVFAGFVLAMGVLLFEMLRSPAGMQREHRIERRRIFSSTRTVVAATPDEVIRLLQTDWSWWKRARAENMKDLGDGRQEFLFHPVRYFGLIEVPPVFLVRFERVESLADGGRRIHASLSGDFVGRAEYSARPGPAGTVVELCLRGVEVRSVLRFVRIALITSMHCWRERIGVQGLRGRLGSMRNSG